METLGQFALFLAETVTLVAAIVVIILLIFGLAEKNKREPGRLEIKKLNDKYQLYKSLLSATTLPKAQAKKRHKLDKKSAKQQAKKVDDHYKRLFILEFTGDLRASDVQSLREEITAVLTAAGADDEVLVKVESPGGMVHAYGLAASQLARIRQAGIRLTVAVDKVAASGGYLMACVADRIIAAPFAIVGSIGVIAQVPNFHRLLQKHDIDFEMITAGEYKRTLTMFGENTDKARQKFKHDMEDIHLLFKEFIGKYRDTVELEKVATGEHWPAIRAVDLNLVDTIQTSDDYLADKAKDHGLFEISYEYRQPLSAKVSGFLQKLSDRIIFHANTST